MRIFKTKAFHKWAAKERIADHALCNAVDEMERGLVDANLGGHVFKKRVAVDSRGKRGGVRTLLAYRVNDKAFFIFGFAKNARANISNEDLAALKRLAKEILDYSDRVLANLLVAGELIEVDDDE